MAVGHIGELTDPSYIRLKADGDRLYVVTLDYPNEFGPPTGVYSSEERAEAAVATHLKRRPNSNPQVREFALGSGGE